MFPEVRDRRRKRGLRRTDVKRPQEDGGIQQGERASHALPRDPTNRMSLRQGPGINKRVSPPTLQKGSRGRSRGAVAAIMHQETDMVWKGDEMVHDGTTTLGDGDPWKMGGSTLVATARRSR